MSKILIIGDIHQKIASVRDVLRYEKDTDLTIQLGDVFDDFDDNIYEVEAAAHWLRESLHNSRRIHLMGNHDIHYMSKSPGSLICSGFASWKHEVISKILTDKDWNNIRYFYSINNIWLSHAGITRYWFEHPVLGTTTSTINDKIDAAKVALSANDISNTGCINAADHYRGGRHKKGGLLWNDWRNIDFFQDIMQIVGHTPSSSVSYKSNNENNGVCLNVDTHMQQSIILDTETKEYKIV